MMKQPELGKKVNDLRNAKGLTQEELAAACNLNVRTIQRIEACEVSPRMYTVRLIFSVLEFDASYSVKQSGRLKIWLGQIYNYTTDLFNLKTNTMRKITILSSPLILCISILFFTNFSAAAQSKKEIQNFVHEENKEFMRMFNNGQIDSLCLRYQINASFMPADSPELSGREAIKGYYYMLYELGFRFVENKSEKLTIKGPIAIDKGIWRLRMANSEELSGYYLSTWHYMDNKWYIETEMSSVATQ